MTPLSDQSHSAQDAQRIEQLVGELRARTETPPQYRDVRCATPCRIAAAEIQRNVDRIWNADARLASDEQGAS